MAIQDDNTVLSKGDLKAYHEKILPYLGGNFMLGTNVSDYYSTDEKIVGVWTDGKPVYQKTIVTNTGSSGNATYPIASWNIDKIINYNGVIEQIVNEKYYYPNIFYNADSTYHCNIYLDRDVNKVLNIRVGSGYYNYDAYIAIQYTKTTDAANSAVATPGCYDINRPDLWPANKEIFFGNGLYGFRYKKTDFNVTTGTIKDEIIFSSTTSNFRIISSGGQFGSASAYQILGGDFVHNGNGTLKHMMGCTMFRSGDGTNPFYIRIVNVDWSVPVTQCDVWVTYTK